MVDENKSSSKLLSLMRKNNGFLKTSDVTAAGISRETLRLFVLKNNLNRVARGVYASSECWDDEWFYVASSCKEIIYSGETALYLHGLMQREPFYTSVTVKYGYNARNLLKRGFKVTTTIKEKFYLGKTSIVTPYGNIVPVYDLDRTICDVICHKDRMDVEVFRYAIREYMSSPKKNLNNLFKYAKALRVDDLVRVYTEVMI